MSTHRSSGRRRAGVTAVALAATAVVTTVLASAGASTASPDTPSRPKPTVVLVHGAFADSSSWNDVVAKLRRDGYPVLAVSNPLRGLASDAGYVADTLGLVDGPVVLVGHSYGGAVITNAARSNPNVKALVYIAGFAPDEGETAAELAGRFPGSTLGPTLTEVRLRTGDTDLYIDQAKFREQFAQDVPQKQAALMAATQRPITAAALNEPSGAAAWRSVPSWFLIPAGDRNIPPAAQEFMATRAQGQVVKLSGNTSHAVTVSRPDAVTRIITNAAG